MALVNVAKLTSSYVDASGMKKTVTNNSNEVVVFNALTDFVKTKETNKDTAIVGEQITMIVTLENKTNFEIKDIFIKDITSYGATFKTGSVVLNSEKREDLDPVLGIKISDTLFPNEIFELVYTFTVNKTYTSANITSSSLIDYTLNSEKFTDKTNDVNIKIFDNLMKITKKVDKNVAKTGEILTFFVNIENSSNFERAGHTFFSDIPKELEFVQNSVEFDDVLQEDLNPEKGIALPTLYPHDQVNIKFKTKVK